MSLKLNSVLENAKNKGIKSNTEDKEKIKQPSKPWHRNSNTSDHIKNIIDDDSENVISIDPHLIENWQYHDRPDTELGDIESLANEFRSIGQQQPCIVRQKLSSNTYDLIVGERRWRAALLANINLKVIVRDLTDSEAALCQAAENDNRVDLSEYAKGISYSKLIEDGVIKQKDLIEKLGRTKQYISALLSFSKIPKVLLDSVGDWSKVSANTAEIIKQLCNKDSENIDKLILNSAKIRSGKFGRHSIEKLTKVLPASKSENQNSKVLTKTGQHLFTWRNDNNDLPSIHFPKQIYKLISAGELDISKISNQLAEFIENELSKRK